MVFTVPGHQVVVLLVAQSLDGCGVKGLDVLLVGQEDGKISHDGLAGPCRSRDQDVLAVLQSFNRLDLEPVQSERLHVLEASRGSGYTLTALAEPGIPLRWAERLVRFLTVLMAT